MTYRTEIRPRAVKQLKKLDSVVRKRIDAAILSLAENPRPPYPKDGRYRP